MNHNFLNEVSSRILEIKSFNKKTIFSISTTAKQEENSYMTPIRDCDSFVLTGCIIFDQKILPTLLKKIDGEVDVILVDSEKKNLCASTIILRISQNCIRQLAM